jgi:hypothetical protein
MKSSYIRSRSVRRPHSHLDIVLVTALAACVCSLGLASASPSGDRQSLSQSSTNRNASSDGIWRMIDSTQLTARESSSPRSYQTTELNRSALASALDNAPMEFTEAAKRSRVTISLPMPDGTFERFAVEESPVMESALASQFPEIKSYRGQGIDDTTSTTRFDLSPLGLHAAVLSTRGSVYVEPYTAGDSQHYIVYFKEQLQDGFTPPQCGVSEELQGNLQRGIDWLSRLPLNIQTIPRMEVVNRRHSRN